jgi:cGMP-dependent protein kinase 1
MGSCMQKRSKSDPNTDNIMILSQRKNKNPPSPVSLMLETSRKDLFEETASLIIVDKPRSQSDILIISECFKKNSVFNTLTPHQIQLVSQSMELYTFKENKTIISQNTQGSMFYIIKSGKLEVIADKKRVGILKEMDCFGELALMHDNLRSSTVNTLTECFLWGIHRETFKVLIEEISKSTYKENFNLISTIPAFQSLDSSQIDALLGCLVSIKYPTNKRIIKANDIDNTIFIVKEGIVSCVFKGVEVKRMDPGSVFGELALLDNCSRQATVTAINDVVCLVSTKDKLYKALGQSFHRILYYNSIYNTINENKYLSMLNSNQIKQIISFLDIKTLTLTKNIIIKSGTLLNTSIYLTLQGDFRYNDQVVNKFTFFGLEEALLGSEGPLEYDLICKENGDIAVISCENLLTAIGGSYNALIESNSIQKALNSIKIFNHLNANEILLVSSLLKTKFYELDEVIVEENTNCDCIFIVKQGEFIATINEKQYIKRISDIFGEREAICNINPTYTVKCTQKGACWVLNITDLFNTLKPETFDFIKQRVFQKDLSIPLQSLIPLKVLKSLQNFTKVLVKTLQGQLYVLKAISKYYLNDDGIKSIKQECDILESIDHPLILQCINVYKDTSRLYMLYEYIQGVNLASVLDSIPNTDNVLKFFTGFMVEMLDYLGCKGIVHRRFSPQHFVIDIQGYLILDTLEQCKMCKDRTYTVVGEPFYMSPEMVNNKGYDYTSNYWTLGIIMFELLYKKVPFGFGQEDPFEIYKSIIAKRLIYPEGFNEMNEYRKIIEQLLCKNPSLRMPGGIAKFKVNRYFKDIDWSLIRNKRIQSPFVSMVKPELLDFKDPLESIDIKEFPQNFNEKWSDLF